METNILIRIFFDEHGHWVCFAAKHKDKLRSNVLKEVVKFRGCGDLSRGFKLLVCEGCHDLRLEFRFAAKEDSVQLVHVERQKNGHVCGLLT